MGYRGYMGVARKKEIFRPKMDPGGRPDARHATGSTQSAVFCVPS